MKTKKRFPWGRVVEVFTYDFDGATLELVKHHPWKRRSSQIVTDEPDEARVHFHCEELHQSFATIEAALIAWIASRSLGINQYALVAGVCRALCIRDTEA